MIDDFIERKWGRRKVEYLLPPLEGILKDSLGVIVYQEQVMRIANVLASYSLGEADLLRRAMGKKDPAAMAKQRDRFMEGAPSWDIRRPRSKRSSIRWRSSPDMASTSRTRRPMRWVAYQTAYLKTHYPVEFMAALLTSETSKPENVVKYIGECKEIGIQVLPPDVQISGAQFTPVETSEGEAIRFGLAAVKNVGGNAIESIIKASDRSRGALQGLLGVLREGRPAGDEQARDRVADQSRCARFAWVSAARSSPESTRRWRARRRRRKTPHRDRLASSDCSMKVRRKAKNGHDLPEGAGLGGRRAACQRERGA